MSIKETVKQAISQIPGNQRFTVESYPLCQTEYKGELLTPSQIKKALNSLPHVRKLNNGLYIVKGRRVPK